MNHQCETMERVLPPNIEKYKLFDRKEYGQTATSSGATPSTGELSDEVNATVR